MKLTIPLPLQPSGSVQDLLGGLLNLDQVLAMREKRDMDIRRKIQSETDKKKKFTRAQSMHA